MVFEDILDKFGKRKMYALFLGILYVLISYGTAQLFFPADVSLAVIFFITLLLIPSTAKLIGIEEEIERKEGLHHFFKDHGILMEIFLFLFIGIFVGYVIVGNFAPDVIAYQINFLEGQGLVGNFVDQKIDMLSQFTSILINNVSVILIAFVLSIFYGVGALFLIVLNASVFASFILKFSEISSQLAVNATVFSVHFIPEVFGFLLAAIAGGVISKAIVQEKVGSDPFKNVVKDGTVLLVLSLAIIVVAALLEVFVTPWLVKIFIS